MRKTKLLPLACLASSVLALSAAPVVRESSVTFTQGQNAASVTIGYVLDGDPAVVTVDIQTNGVSIGAENFRSLSGDVGRVVQPGSRTVKWAARADWPEHKLTDGSVTAV